MKTNFGYNGSWIWIQQMVNGSLFWEMIFWIAYLEGWITRTRHSKYHFYNDMEHDDNCLMISLGYELHFCISRVYLYPMTVSWYMIGQKRWDLIELFIRFVPDHLVEWRRCCFNPGGWLSCIVNGAIVATVLLYTSKLCHCEWHCCKESKTASSHWSNTILGPVQSVQHGIIQLIYHSSSCTTCSKSSRDCTILPLRNTNCAYIPCWLVVVYLNLEGDSFFYCVFSLGGRFFVIGSVIDTSTWWRRWC